MKPSPHTLTSSLGSWSFSALISCSASLPPSLRLLRLFPCQQTGWFIHKSLSKLGRPLGFPEMVLMLSLPFANNGGGRSLLVKPAKWERVKSDVVRTWSSHLPVFSKVSFSQSHTWSHHTWTPHVLFLLIPLSFTVYFIQLWTLALSEEAVWR